MSFLHSLFAGLQPKPVLTDQQVTRGLSTMVWEGVASGGMFSLGSGAFMAGYALSLGANNFQIGILAALPFITQAFQIPAIVLVERFRRRKMISVPLWFGAQSMWFFVALAPFLLGAPGAGTIAMVAAALGIRGLFVAFVNVGWNSWMRDLVPQAQLGRYYGSRSAKITAVTAAIGLAAAFFIDYWRRTADPGQVVFGYSYLLLAGALIFGMGSVILMAATPEPAMPRVPGEAPSIRDTLAPPLRDKNFKQLIRFLFFWSFASNLAVPFFAVYMLTVLGLSISLVVGLTILSHLANILFVRVWGPLADRFGSKTVLSLSSSLYLLVIVGWTFTTMPGEYFLTLPLLVVLHIFAGVAAAGVSLTVTTLGLKLAPGGQATPYVGVAGLATNIGTGLGPLVGGRFVDFFSQRSFTITFSWIDPSRTIEFPALALTGFDFLFAVAFVLGLACLNILVALKEEGEVPREEALSALLTGGGPVSRMVSSVPGLNVVSGAAYSYLRRIPGFDVAFGVTAYQLASTTRSAVRAAAQGGDVVTEVSRRVSGLLSESVRALTGARDRSAHMARETARGAALAAGDMVGSAAGVARGAFNGTLAALSQHDEPFDLDVLHGAGYGLVEGAVQSGADPGALVAEAAQSAWEAAESLGLEPEQAADKVIQGALEAAAAAGPESVVAVQKAVTVQPFGPPNAD